MPMNDSQAAAGTGEAQAETMASVSLTPEPISETRREWVKRVLGWTDLPLKIASVITLAWSILTFLLPRNDLDLVVWMEKRSALFPSTATDGRRLPFVFEQRAVHSADLWQVRVTNEGKSYIGAQDRQWDLVLSHPRAEIVRVIDTPISSSNRNQVSIVPSSAPNEARVRMGALAHGHYASFHLLFLNANAPLTDELKVATTLEGIPRPLSTTQSPQDRLTGRLAPFAMSAVLIVVGTAAIKEMQQLHLLRSPVAILKYAGMTIVASIFFTAFLSPLLAWGLWWFL